jgi:hypothetical protein
VRESGVKDDTYSMWDCSHTVSPYSWILYFCILYTVNPVDRNILPAVVKGQGSRYF